MSLRNDKKLVKHFKFDRASISNPVYIIPEPNPYFPNTKSQKKTNNMTDILALLFILLKPKPLILMV